MGRVCSLIGFVLLSRRGHCFTASRLADRLRQPEGNLGRPTRGRNYPKAIIQDAALPRDHVTFAQERKALAYLAITVVEGVFAAYNARERPNEEERLRLALLVFLIHFLNDAVEPLSPTHASTHHEGP